MLVENGIAPYVTLYHSEMPLALALYPRSNNPFLAGDFPEIFANYSDVVFAKFGNRVKVLFNYLFISMYVARYELYNNCSFINYFPLFFHMPQMNNGGYSIGSPSTSPGALR